MNFAIIFGIVVITSSFASGSDAVERSVREILNEAAAAKALQNEVKAMQNENKAMQNENKAMQSEMKDLRSENQALKSKVTQLPEVERSARNVEVDASIQNKLESLQEESPVHKLDDMVLFRSRQNGSACYRIPVIDKTKRGTLIAIVEARRNNCGDYASKYIAMRRSFDGGSSWTRIRFIYEDKHRKGLFLGAIIVDDRTGTIFLQFVICWSNYSPSACRNTPTSTLMIWSLDDGETWHGPRNLSKTIGLTYFVPLGHGIIKQHEPHQGRIILCGQRTLLLDGVYTIISDDKGKTWSHAGYVEGRPYNKSKSNGDFVPDECQAVETANGTIVINARNQEHWHGRYRIVMRSDDGGDTFPKKDIVVDKSLVDPACSASLLEYRDVMFFSNPANKYHRVNLTLRWSTDEGVSWDPRSLSIHEGSSAYSALVKIQDEADHKDSDKTGKMGILYERNSEIAFTRLEVNFAKLETP